MFSPTLLALMFLAVGLSMIAVASLSLLGWAYARSTADESERLMKAATDINYGLWPAGFGLFVLVYAFAHPEPVSALNFWSVLGANLLILVSYYGFLRKWVVKMRLNIREKRRSSGA